MRVTNQTLQYRYVLATVENDLDPTAVGILEGHTVPSYCSLFIFAFIYELILVYDTLRLNSMIQLVGLCIYNFLLLLYAAVQPRTIGKALKVLANAKNMDITPLLKPGRNTWHRVQPALIIIVVDQTIATAALLFLTYKLRSEFAWVVYKILNADLSMRRRLFNFQVYMALIKFNFFFLLGFMIQTISLIGNPKHDIEVPLTVAGIFVALAVMGLAIYCARFENKAGTAAVIIAYVGAAVYLSWKLANLSVMATHPLIVFNALTLAMMVATIVMAIVCMANFGKGLKTYTMPQKRLSEENIHLHHTHNYAGGTRVSRLDLGD
ncbi:hypothetical protein PG985_004107 [Apiospora marii]|uniref:uncharacterized protein n=1 Tax=Apiospora marii TaxID=335849 RepID=UPI003131639F